MRRYDRGFDHLVIATADLAAARNHWQDWGFTPTAVAHHPWGTMNSLIQLEGQFLEILAVEEASKISPHAPDQGFFSFGAFNQQFLTRQQGAGMLVFQSRDAREDAADFAYEGLGDFAPFDFERQAIAPDGSAAKVAFSLAFAPLAGALGEDICCFTCQNHFPENFWKPAYQQHANGARKLVEVTIQLGDPQQLQEYCSKIQGDGALHFDPDGDIVVDTADGLLALRRPESLRRWYGAPAEALPAGRQGFVACRIGVQDLDASLRYFHDKGLATDWAPAGLLLRDAWQQCGMLVAFSQI